MLNIPSTLSYCFQVRTSEVAIQSLVIWSQWGTKVYCNVFITDLVDLPIFKYGIIIYNNECMFCSLRTFFIVKLLVFFLFPPKKVFFFFLFLFCFVLRLYLKFRTFNFSQIWSKYSSLLSQTSCLLFSCSNSIWNMIILDTFTLFMFDIWKYFILFWKFCKIHRKTNAAESF